MWQLPIGFLAGLEGDHADRRPGMTFNELHDWFWTQVDIRGQDECWPWRRGVTSEGYGTFKYQHKAWRTNRFVLGLTSDDDLYALHSCDNPPCCNPGHLRGGTHAENMQDRGDRNRAAGIGGGEANSNSHLTWEQVAEIRSRYADGAISQRALADEYEMCQSSISKIVRQEAWLIDRRRDGS